MLKAIGLTILLYTFFFGTRHMIYKGHYDEQDRRDRARRERENRFF